MEIAEGMERGRGGGETEMPEGDGERGRWR
jgi:hypothetical protein